MVLTLLSSCLRLFCFRERQGQRSNSLVNKRIALINIQAIPDPIFRDSIQQPFGCWDSGSGARFFSVAPQVGNPIPQLRATALIAFGFSDSERKLQLLQLMTTLKET